MHRKKPIECIDPAKVPCDKARAYLEKKGLLCTTDKPVKTKRKKSVFEEWFG